MIGVERLGERKRLSVGMLFSSCCMLDGDGIFKILFFLPWHVCSLLTSRSMLLNNKMKLIFYQVLKSF